MFFLCVYLKTGQVGQSVSGDLRGRSVLQRVYFCVRVRALRVRANAIGLVSGCGYQSLRLLWDARRRLYLHLCTFLYKWSRSYSVGRFRYPLRFHGGVRISQDIGSVTFRSVPSGEYHEDPSDGSSAFLCVREIHCNIAVVRATTLFHYSANGRRVLNCKDFSYVGIDGGSWVCGVRLSWTVVWPINKVGLIRAWFYR